MMMTTKFVATLYVLLVSSKCCQVDAFLPAKFQRKTIITRTSADASENKALEEGKNPCWEDIYDDDCVMTNAASAQFVAADWIKSMPCGEGIQDCDMPVDLTAPETRPEAGIDHVDVMNMLGLKRAKNLESK